MKFIINEAPRPYRYVVGFTFGQHMETKDRVFAYVRTKRTEKWAIQRAVDLTVDMARGLQSGQIETKVFKDEDEMADYWYDQDGKAKDVVYDGLKSSDLL